MSTELTKSNLELQLIEMWVHGRSPCTQDYYRRSAHRFLAHCNKPLAQVTLADVQSFATVLAEQGLVDSTLKTYLSGIKSLLSFGYKLGMLPVNVGVALKLSTPKDALNERILSEADVTLLMRLEPDASNRLILRLLYATGIRVSELVGLRWCDLKERSDGGQVTVFGKGSKTRTVLLPSTIWKELMDFKGLAVAEQPVFKSPKNGGHCTRQHIHNIVKAAGERVGLKNVSPHWMRHAHASHSLDRGAPIHLVQQTLGHSSVATTGRYLHARPTDSSSRYLSL